MKLFRSLFTLFVIAVIGITLIIMCPTKDDFAAYYVSNNQTGLGDFFDGGFKTIVKQQTKEENYLFFAVFEVAGKDKYVGILGNFFGRSSADQVKKTVEDLIENE